MSCKLSLMEIICMTCQILFSGMNEKKFIYLSYAEFALREVTAKQKFM